MNAPTSLWRVLEDLTKRTWAGLGHAEQIGNFRRGEGRLLVSELSQAVDENSQAFVTYWREQNRMVIVGDFRLRSPTSYEQAIAKTFEQLELGGGIVIGGHRSEIGNPAVGDQAAQEVAL